MPTLEVSLQFTLDGVVMPDLTIIRRLVVDRAIAFDAPVASSASIAIGGFTTIQVLLARSLDQPATVILSGGTPVDLSPGGFLLLFDGGATSAAINNTGPGTAQVQGVQAGT